MLKRHRNDLATRYNEAHPELGEGPKPLRKIMRRADAAVRGWVAGQYAFVQRHARPRNALHERHRGAAVDIRMVIAILFDDAEYAHWGGMSGHAGRHRSLRNPDPVAVERYFLRADIDDDLQWPLRHVSEAHFLLGFGHIVPPAVRDPVMITRGARLPRARSVVPHPIRIGLGGVREHGEE